MILAFDILLVLLLAASAAAAFLVRNLFRSIVAFIIYGILMSLVWARLAAPDLALVEVALAAGITGALLLSALAEIKQHPEEHDPRAARLVQLKHLPLAGTLLIAGTALIGVLIASVTGIDPFLDRLGPVVAAELERSGVSSPVTAVLLNFRSYDTLLEIAVLVIATVSAWGLGKAPALPREPPPAVMLDRASALLLPVVIIVAGYLLWRGSAAPGGAFQAAAVLASGVILYLLAHPHAMARLRPEPLVLFWVMAGCGTFLAAGLLRLTAGSAFLEYPPASAKTYIVIIESAAMLSIATMLVVLFLAGATAKSWPKGGDEQ